MYKRQVDKLHNGTRRQELDQAVAKAQETAANRDFLQREYERKQAAYDASQGRSISDESLDDVKSKLDAATARANEAQANYELALAGPRKEDIASGDVYKRQIWRRLMGTRTFGMTWMLRYRSNSWLAGGNSSMMTR